MATLTMNPQPKASRQSTSSAYAYEEEDETVVIRPLQGSDDPAKRELRISCPDATGLGCDIARLLLDFGLQILDGDVSTDGSWCFMIFKVQVSAAVRVSWALLKRRIEQLAPRGTNISTRDLQRLQQARPRLVPFLLQITSEDRHGFLRALMQVLWEGDVTVFKAHITTGPDRVLDSFWIYDNKGELHQQHRVLQITELVRDCLPPGASCMISPAPSGTAHSSFNPTGIIPRSSCVDALPASPLRQIVSCRRIGRNGSEATIGSAGASSAGSSPGTVPNGGLSARYLASSPSRSNSRLGIYEGEGGPRSQNGSMGKGSGDSLRERERERESPGLTPAEEGTPEEGDEAVWDEHLVPEDVEVSLDNQTSSSYSVVSVRCRDRKGLVYDLMRSLHVLRIRVAYAKVGVRAGRAEAELFVEEADAQRIAERRRRCAAQRRLAQGRAGALPPPRQHRTPQGAQRAGSSGSSLDALALLPDLDENDTRIVDPDLEAELLERVRHAVLLPVRISLQDQAPEGTLSLCVMAPLDSGGRGRPRVLYDVTSALFAKGVSILRADVFTEEVCAFGGERRRQEQHRFVLQGPDGPGPTSLADKRAIYNCVRTSLTGGDLAACLKESGTYTPQDTSRALGRPPSSKAFGRWKWSI